MLSSSAMIRRLRPLLPPLTVTSSRIKFGLTIRPTTAFGLGSAGLTPRLPVCVK